MAQRGDRVRLLTTSDPHVTLQRGTEGTVVFVDSLGTTHVEFDNGTKLGLIADEDAFELVEHASPDTAAPGGD